MDLISEQGAYGNYTYDIDGYIQTSYVNISTSNVDNYVNNTEYLDLNTNTLSTIVTVPEDESDHGFTYKCHLDISGMFELDFNLPNFLSVPGVNLTLFKKMDEFSRQIADLNSNMIAFIQSTGCCEVSYEYNKTVVPIFRYLADNPETRGCNTQDPNVKEGETCSYNSNENFISEILKAIREITKVYTTIEPIFCIIKPIPGNPWLPIDFNWIRPILPYIEKYSKFAEKIMSGELIDVIIDPVKDINRSLFNCRQENKNFSIDKTISSTAIINGITEIQSAEEFAAAVDELDARTLEARVAALETIQKYSDIKDFAGEYKALADLLKAKETSDAEKIELLKEYNSTLKTISTNYSKSEQNKIAAYFQTDKNKPLQCLQEYITFRPDLPKLPAIDISILPEDGNTQLKNDLIQVIDEKAYDITYEDIYGDVKEFNNAKVKIMKEKIRFDRNTVFNSEFIKKFRDYIQKDASEKNEARTYKKVNNFNWRDYLEDETLTTDSFNISLMDNTYDYLANKSTLEGVLDKDYELWDTSHPTFSETSALPDLILKNNTIIANEISKLQIAEADVVKDVRVLEDKDLANWNIARDKALAVVKRIKEKRRQLLNNTINEEEGAVGDVLNWWEKINYNVTDYTVELADYMFTEIFHTYYKFDIINDPFDKKLNPVNFAIPSDNDLLNILKEIILDYLKKRKLIIGNEAVKEVVANFEKELIPTSSTSGTSSETPTLSTIVGLIKEINQSTWDNMITACFEWQEQIDPDTGYPFIFVDTLQPPPAGGSWPYVASTFEIQWLEAAAINNIRDSYDFTGYTTEEAAAKLESNQERHAILAASSYTPLIQKSLEQAGFKLTDLETYGFLFEPQSWPQAGTGDNRISYDLNSLIEIKDKMIKILDSYTEAASSVLNDFESTDYQTPSTTKKTASPSLMTLLLRIFKYERVKKEYFLTIDNNIAYKFYVTFIPEIKLGCNLICELIQFVINYLLAIIKKLMMIIVYWLIDYLVPDWLKNLVRLILYKLKCFLMIAYNYSEDEDKNRILKIDRTYTSFMDSIRNRIELYPYDACAKTAIDNAIADAAADYEDNVNDNLDTQVDTAVSHILDIYFAGPDLSILQSISKYNYKDVKIVIKKDSLATLSNLVIKDYEDTLTGPSATDLTAAVNGYNPEAEIDTSAHWYLTTAANGDIIVNNLDLSLLKTALAMVSTNSTKSTADIPEKYDSHVVSNRYSTLNVTSSIIQLQDAETKSFLTLLESNKRFLKILFKKEPEADITSLVLTDNTPYVTAAVATADTEEIIGSAPLESLKINLANYEILYDSIYNLSYIIVDCTNFFPAGNTITGTLSTISDGVSTTVRDSILCSIDKTTATSTNNNTEEAVVNDTFITSTAVIIPELNPDPETQAALQEAGVSQARTETPVIFNCFNSSGTITEILEANYESWIALGLIPDPTIT